MLVTLLVATVPSPPPNMWSPISAASGYAQLAGILAGFVFISLTIAVATPRQSESQEAHKTSSTMLATAFVVLLVAALFFVVISGEMNDYRASFMATVASSVLGLGALLLMSGTAWLFFEYGLADSASQNFKFLSLVLLLLAATFVAFTVEDITQWSNAEFPDVYATWMAIAGSFGVALLFLIGWMTLPVALGRSTAQTSSEQLGVPRTISKLIRMVSQACMIYLLMASALMAWLVVSPDLGRGPETLTGELLQFRLVVYAWTPVYLVLYVAVILMIPWRRFLRHSAR
jgi:hypothetical protein